MKFKFLQEYLKDQIQKVVKISEIKYQWKFLEEQYLSSNSEVDNVLLVLPKVFDCKQYDKLN